MPNGLSQAMEAGTNDEGEKDPRTLRYLGQLVDRKGVYAVEVRRGMSLTGLCTIHTTR